MKIVGPQITQINTDYKKNQCNQCNQWTSFFHRFPGEARIMRNCHEDSREGIYDAVKMRRGAK